MADETASLLSAPAKTGRRSRSRSIGSQNSLIRPALSYAHSSGEQSTSSILETMFMTCHIRPHACHRPPRTHISQPGSMAADFPCPTLPKTTAVSTHVPQYLSQCHYNERRICMAAVRPGGDREPWDDSDAGPNNRSGRNMRDISHGGACWTLVRYQRASIVSSESATRSCII